MITQKKSSSSFDSLSIKLTQTNIPSATVIKQSKDHISLTYTASLENIQHQLYSFKHLHQNNLFDQNLNDVSIEEHQQTEQSLEQETSKQSILKQTQKHLQDILEKDVFKKKSVLKISNIDFSQFLEHLKENSRPTSPQKSILNKKTGGNVNNRNNNHSFAFKNKHINQPTNHFSSQNSSHNNLNQMMIQSRQFSKSKQKIYNHNQFNEKSSQNFAQGLLLRTRRFNSIKQDKIVEPLRKNSILFKKGQKQSENTACSSRNKRNSISTQRKSLNPNSNRKTKFPALIQKGLSYASHPVNFTSSIMRKKAFSSYQNGQTYDKNFGIMTQKILIGKSCKLNEDDNKARKYLKKIIQSRNSILHFIQ